MMKSVAIQSSKHRNKQFLVTTTADPMMFKILWLLHEH